MKDRLPHRVNSLHRVLLSVCLICSCLLCLHSTAHARRPTFTLQSARGRVEVRVGGKGEWVRVKRGVQPTSPGDRVRTGPNGSVCIVTGDGARLALAPNTEVVLREPDKPRGWRVILGRILTAITGAGRLEVRAPAAVAAAEGTTFQIEVAEDGKTVLTVVEGQVQFSNDLGSVTVMSSQQSTAEVGQAPTRPIVVDPSSLTAWEANLQTLIIDLEYPQVSTDPERLEQELTGRQEAVRRRPTDPAAHAALAEVLLDLGRTDEALAQARQAAEMGPDERTYRGVLGYALLKSGRPAEARDEFALASESEPDNARWRIGLALVALGQRDAKPAADLLQQAAQLARDDPLPQAYLAATYLRAGELERAATSASEAVRLGPDHYLANTYMAYVRLAEGRVDEAISAARSAVQAAPQSPLAHEALGSALLFAGDFADARQEVGRSLDLDPLSASSHLTLAKLLAAEDEIEPALHQAQLAVGLNPRSAPARSALGLLFLLNKDPERAGRQFQQALAMDPSLSEARTGWGLTLLKRGRFREALDQQKAAVSLDTDSASAHSNLGGVYASLGRMDLAMEHLKCAIQLQPGWGMPYANLALVHLEENRFREALDAGEQAVALGERSPFVHTMLARIYMRQGRSDRALAELRQAVALDEHYPQAHFQLAKLYLQQDRARDAVREILASVATDPSAMLETRQYARTEDTLSVGSHGLLHFDARHSSQASQGRLSYFASGLSEDSDGFRPVNQDSSEKFVEVIAGHQSQPTSQLVFFSTLYDRTAGLPGPVTAASVGDSDDRQDFTGYEAVLAYRQRLSPAVTGTVKYSFRRSQLDFRNPDSLTTADTNPFSTLVDESTQHSPEILLDADVSDRSSLRLGYSHLWDRRERRGVAWALDPDAGALASTPFSTRATPRTETAWVEAYTRASDRFDLSLGEYWGRETGTSSVVLPKVVALYRPDQFTWWSFVANPIFRTDALELAPVEALADPRGLGYLDFTEGGAGRSYELRYQRQGSRSSNITASLAHQRVRGLLADVQDPALAGLPMRVLADRGSRWVGDASYEQWLNDAVTGRAWVRWQSSRGRFPESQVDGTEWPYSPRWQAGGRLDYIDADGFRVGLAATWVGSRFHDAENLRRVASYTVVNLRVQYQRDLHRNYFLDVLNLTGTDYETFAEFPQPDRAVIAGLEYRY